MAMMDGEVASPFRVLPTPLRFGSVQRGPSRIRNRIVMQWSVCVQLSAVVITYVLYGLWLCTVYMKCKQRFFLKEQKIAAAV